VASIPAGFEDYEVTTQYAVEEKRKLKKSISRLDILFFLLCTIVGFDTIGATAASGAEAFTWLIFLGIFFFLPYALLTSELGSGFPEEGGAYAWVKLAFGRRVAAVNTLFYWASNPIWVGGSLAFVALAAFNTFFTPLTGFWAYAFQFVFIWVTIIAATVAVSAGKWLQTIGALVRIFVLGFFTLSVVIYAIRNGVGGVGGDNFIPTYVGFIGLVPILFFNYAGFEIPSNAGDEMQNPRHDVPAASFRAFVLSVLLYGGPILAILLVLPAAQVSSLGGFLDAIKAVFTVWGGSVSPGGTPTLSGFGLFLGWISAGAVIIGVLTSAMAWLMGANRAYAVAALDGSAPKAMGKLSKDGTPIVTNIITGILATIIMVLASMVVSGSAEAYFSAVLGLAISTTTISYIFVFPALVKLRYSHAQVERPYRVPGGSGGAWIVSILTTFWAVLATVSLVWPGFGIGWFGTAGNPAEVLADLGFANQRLVFELTQIVPLVVVLVLGLVFYQMGEGVRKRAVEVPLDVEEAAVGGDGDPP
jgi:amino acid transporter